MLLRHYSSSYFRHDHHQSCDDSEPCSSTATPIITCQQQQQQPEKTLKDSHKREGEDERNNGKATLKRKNGSKTESSNTKRNWGSRRKEPWLSATIFIFLCSLLKLGMQYYYEGAYFHLHFTNLF